jgi:peptidoglycan/LPS O-acetylase OafA/YrhL
MMNKKNLRIDIEALRGLSVILVILYHFKLSNLDYQIIKGGFVGVDIFFVISGFIITKIIIENKIENFSLLYFYERRIKRIIPLLSIVLIVSIASLFFVFDFFLLNKNINASFSISTAVSNFYFWASAVLYHFAEKNSLINLHFWSLSIEMQFYIFFPLLFIVFKSKEKVIHFIIFMLIGLSYLFVIKNYKTHNMFNFYNSFSRVFEFLSGAIIFLYSDFIKQKIKKKFHSYIYLLGLIILFLYLQFLQNENYHPSPHTLVFIFGIGLMIIFNNDESFKKIKIGFSYLGKISYSLYLWHFPILVLGSYLFVEFTDYKKLILILACFIVSIITYFLIEKRFRAIKLLYSLILFLILILFLVIAKYASNSKKENYTNYNLDNNYLAYESSIYLRNINKYSLRQTKNIFSFKNDSVNFSPQFNPKNSKQKVLIIGDSHSKDLFNIFKTNEAKFENYEFARYGINLVDFENYRKKNLLLSHNFKHADYILYSQRYKKKDLAYLQKLIELADQSQKKLIIFLKKPEFVSNNKKNQTILDLFYLKEEKIPSKVLMDSYFFDQLKYENFKTINNQIKKMYKNQVTLYDIYSILCDDNKSSCHSIDKNGKKMFYDYGHTTLEGSRYIGNILFDSKFHENYLR